MQYCYRGMWKGLLISEGCSRCNIANEICEMVPLISEGCSRCDVAT